MPTEDRYDWLLHRLPVLASLMDLEGRFTDVSDEFEQRLGFTRAELKGRHPVDIATPESVARIQQEHLPQFRRTGRLDHAPVEFIAKSGEIVELLATTIPESRGRGRPRNSLSVFSELSDQARLERRIRALYRATPAMLHSVDENGRILDASDHWLEKLGYQRSEVIGRSVLDFMAHPAEDGLTENALQRQIRAFIANGGENNVPRAMVTRAGEVIEILMSVRVLRDPRDGTSRLLVASKDVTERNRAEAQLREAYNEIERLKVELEQERDYLREEVQVSMNFGRIVGASAALAGMLSRIEAVAQTPSSVLIIGETGTGKELVAHAIHARSQRADGPLVKVNCASIPDELFESEFFGHVKGAFTGAHRDRVGRFQLADGGTIFLDEVGEIPLALQGKLLRVLQEKELERVGEDKTRSVDVRVIAATNKDLEKAVEAGEFREDLYYRLSVFPVNVPPLRKRGDDVIMLAQHFLEQVCREFGRPVPQLTQKQVELLNAYSWPGNVRELKNVIERAVILSERGPLRLDLSLAQHGRPGAAPPALAPPADAVAPLVAGQRVLTEAEMREFQKANLVAALEECGWRVSGDGGAADRLGLKPSTLSDRMRSLGIRRPAA